MNQDVFCPSFRPSPVSQKLVDLIERDADALTREYLSDIQKNHDMPTYRSFNQREVYDRGFRVFSQLGRWLSMELSQDEVRDYWTHLGRKRRQEGFSMTEIFLSLCLIRRRIWDKIEREGLLDTAMDLRLAMDLYCRVTIFFDRATLFAVRGFEGRE